MVYTFEIVGIVFLLSMFYMSHLEYKKHRLNRKEFAFWAVCWTAGLLLVIFHNYINFILPQINILRVLDLYMILSFIFLFILVFHLFSSVKHVEKRVEEVVRQVALRSVKK